MHWKEFLRKARSFVDRKVLMYSAVNYCVGVGMTTTSMTINLGSEKLFEILWASAINEVMQALVVPTLIAVGTGFVSYLLRRRGLKQKHVEECYDCYEGELPEEVSKKIDRDRIHPHGDTLLIASRVIEELYESNAISYEVYQAFMQAISQYEKKTEEEAKENRELKKIARTKPSV